MQSISWDGRKRTVTDDRIGSGAALARFVSQFLVRGGSTTLTGRNRRLPRTTNPGTVKSADVNGSSDRRGPVLPRRDRPRYVVDRILVSAENDGTIGILSAPWGGAGDTTTSLPQHC